MTAPNLILKTAIGSYGNTQALKDGRVTISGVTLDFAEITPVYKAFMRMIQQLEFDVSEMAFTTYMVAKAFDKQLTALPLVIFRKFHHATIVCNVNSGIREPKDLEGKRVGIRAFAQTGPTWSRGILQSEYGVDLRKVTWITYEGSHVKELQDPEYIIRAPKEKQMNDMLRAGEIDAAVMTNPLVAPEVRPLFPNAAEVEIEWFKKTGIYPVNHIVVVKPDLAASQPWVLKELFNAFNTSKELYLKRLEAQGPSSAEDKRVLEMKGVMGDPFPYGIAPNRKAIETISQFAFQQGLLPRPYSVEDLFDASVMDLVG